MRKTLLLGIAIMLPFAAACGTSVKRLDTDEVKDLSGRWNDTDSRLVADEMIADSLSRPWYGNAQAALRRPPVVKVGAVSNQSSEHINTDTFVENLQRSLINSGKVDFVASSAEQGQVRGERVEQDTNATDDTRKAQGQETGADFMLTGVINSIEDQEGGKKIVYYQTNLKLIDIQSNRIVWNGEKKIKKYVSRSSMGL
ncbi:MAG: penicillin-binding protein activator LpoB [Elusimicrobiaceae bacterium]|nr:penicillin-binding protein activator LpoB [Elusimicrobiaceae bacterium]